MGTELELEQSVVHLASMEEQLSHTTDASLSAVHQGATSEQPDDSRPGTGNLQTAILVQQLLEEGLASPRSAAMRTAYEIERSIARIALFLTGNLQQAESLPMRDALKMLGDLDTSVLPPDALATLEESVSLWSEYWDTHLRAIDTPFRQEDALAREYLELSVKLVQQARRNEQFYRRVRVTGVPQAPS